MPGAALADTQTKALASVWLSGVNAAQCITPYIKDKRAYFVIINSASNFILQRLTMKC
jgi:hypothetical protein